jgi:hypothetical protein
MLMFFKFDHLTHLTMVDLGFKVLYVKNAENAIDMVPVQIEPISFILGLIGQDVFSTILQKGIVSDHLYL